MSVPIRILDSRGKAILADEREGGSSLLVSTRPYQQLSHQSGFFTNPTHGPDLNVSAAVGGTPDQIHDGGDASLWTGSNVVGSNVDFASVAQFQAGAAAVYLNRMNLNDIAQFAKGADVTMSGYSLLRMHVYIQSGWTSSDVLELYWYDAAGATQVGDRISLEDYVDLNITGSWQLIDIPVTAFGSAAGSAVVDTLQVQATAVQGTAPRVHLDNIRLEASGGASFEIAPGQNELLLVDEIQLTLRDTIAPTLSDATMPLFDPETFLGVTLSAGLGYLRTDVNGVRASATLRSPLDILQLPGSTYDLSSDGTQTMLRMRNTFGEPLKVDGSVGDTVSYSISEDLSGLDFFRIAYKGRVETLGR